MKRRWALGAGLGYERLTARSATQPKVPFTVVEVSGRMRVYPDLEVAANVRLGGGTAEDMTQLSTVAFLGDLRYRLFAGQPWNGYLFGGVGVRSIAEKDADMTTAQPRPSVRVGAGGERRFDRFAIEAEVQYHLVAENAQVPDAAEPTIAYEFARYDLRGWCLAIAGTFYL